MSSVASFVESNESPASIETGGVAPCPLCGGTMRSWLTVPGDWRRPHVSESYLLGWCDECDYGQLLRRPDLHELAASYDVPEYYTHHAPKSAETMRSFMNRVRVHLAWRCDQGIMSEIDGPTLASHGIRSGASVCDVGCGNGGLLSRLTTAGYCVTGIEPDSGACCVAQANGFRVFAGSGELLPVELVNEQFDAVTMTHVLEHCRDVVTTVRNAASLLTSGGALFIETPNNACEGLRRQGTTWRWLDVPRHLNFFTAESLRRVCEQAGLEVTAVEYAGFTRQFLPDWVAEEREIHRRMETMSKPEASKALSPQNSASRAFRLLVATWRAAAARKYDSVRIVARKRYPFVRLAN